MNLINQVETSVEQIYTVIGIAGLTVLLAFYAVLGVLLYERAKRELKQPNDKSSTSPRQG